MFGRRKEDNKAIPLKDAGLAGIFVKGGLDSALIDNLTQAIDAKERGSIEVLETIQTKLDFFCDAGMNEIGLRPTRKPIKFEKGDPRGGGSEYKNANNADLIDS